MLAQFFVRITIVLVFCTPVLAQQYYRWVDANGTVHFSENPPQDDVNATEEEVPQTALTRGSPSTSASPSANSATAAAAGSQATADTERCEKIRSNIQTLTSTSQVRRVDPDTGEAKLMSSEEHQQELERNRRLETENC